MARLLEKSIYAYYNWVLAQTLLALSVLVIIKRVFKISEKKVIGILIIGFGFQIVFLRLIGEQPAIFQQFIIFVTVLTTTPILFIKPPTLVIIKELKNKNSLTYAEIAHLIETNQSSESDFHLTKNRLLVKDGNYSVVGRVVKRFICCFKYD